MNSTPSSDTEFDKPQTIKRKFSLTKEIDDELRTLAAQHYGGNSSQCVRSAIEDHKRSQEGMGERILRRIEDDVAEVKKTVSQLEQMIENSETAGAPPEKTKAEAMDGNGNEMTSKPVTDEMISIYRQIGDAHPNFLPVSEIVASDLSAGDIQRALVNLEDCGFVESCEKNGKIEYKMIESEDLE